MINDLKEIRLVRNLRAEYNQRVLKQYRTENSLITTQETLQGDVFLSREERVGERRTHTHSYGFEADNTRKKHLRRAKTGKLVEFKLVCDVITIDYMFGEGPRFVTTEMSEETAQLAPRMKTIYGTDEAKLIREIARKQYTLKDLYKGNETQGLDALGAIKSSIIIDCLGELINRADAIGDWGTLWDAKDVAYKLEEKAEFQFKTPTLNFSEFDK